MDLDAPHAYGAAFADVYDEWYADRADTPATVQQVAAWASGRPVAELGAGTGRLAIPLALAGVEVHGVDASPEMLSQLTAKRGGRSVVVHQGDMAEGPPPVSGGYGVVLIAYNTLFNLTSHDRQARCFDRSARCLAPTGRFVVEAFVPDPSIDAGGREASRATAAGTVVTTWVHDPDAQTVTGTHRLEGGLDIADRRWKIRYSSPGQLDAMADAAGLALEQRWGGWGGEPFDDHSTHHVSVWSRRGTD